MINFYCTISDRESACGYRRESQSNSEDMSCSDIIVDVSYISKFKSKHPYQHWSKSAIGFYISSK